MKACSTWYLPATYASTLDDLETLADLLAVEKHTLQANISREPDGHRKGKMEAPWHC